MIITIDGPAGTGKSTAARALAERLGFAYLDTGAMYRAVGLACLQQGIEPSSLEQSAAVAGRISLRFEGRQVWMDGVDVTNAIRTPEATEAASIVAQNPEVRSQLVVLQQRAATAGNYVCEGRDQGTVVFPDAEVKFYISASAEVRAERRRRELAEKGEQVSLEELLQQQTERDRRDQERDVAPMRPADDAVLIDTSELSTEDVLGLMQSHIRGAGEVAG